MDKTCGKLQDTEYLRHERKSGRFTRKLREVEMKLQYRSALVGKGHVIGVWRAEDLRSSLGRYARAIQHNGSHIAFSPTKGKTTSRRRIVRYVSCAAAPTGRRCSIVVRLVFLPFAEIQLDLIHRALPLARHLDGGLSPEPETRLPPLQVGAHR